MPPLKITLILPTINASAVAEDFIRSLQAQTLQPQKILLFDSHSVDNTREIFGHFGAEIVMVPPGEFDHGSTRQLAAEKCCADTDILIYLTQDTLLADTRSLANLLSAFQDGRIGAAYGRQLPMEGAAPIESHARLFNYPAESQVKSLQCSKQLGIKTCFMSNSFAAYRCSALRQVGGFPENNIVSEETFVAAKMLEDGWKIKYCAEATVYHSHNYTIRQEFQRYFDLGVFHSREPWIRRQFGQAEGEGQRFVKSQISYLRKDHIFLIPSALIRAVFKYLGFRLGFCEAYLPNKMKVWLSMQKHFWV